jgi:hypothetical protein
MKQPAKPAEQPKALAILVSIVDPAITFGFPEKTPSLSDVARSRCIVSGIAHRRFRRAHQRRKCLRDGDR